MRVSRLAAFVLRAFAAATAAALILDAPAAAAAVGACGLAVGGLVAYRTVEFGRLMHRIIETVARQEALVPVMPAQPAAPAMPERRAA
jgi:hypothetical protein